MKTFLLAALLAVSPVIAQAQTGNQALTGAVAHLSRDDETVSYKFLREVLGFTVCNNGQGYAFIVAGLSEMARRDTEAHERKHVEQIARFPSCEAFDKFVRVEKNNMEIEAEAYATGLCVSVAMGADKISMLRTYAQKLSLWIRGDLSAVFPAWELLNKYVKC